MASAFSIDGGAVKVIHGANGGVFDVAGAPVGSIQASLVDAFNIKEDAISFVNGEQVSPSYILQPNDTLEFCKRSSSKGILRMFTKAEIVQLYTGYPAEVMNELFAALQHDDVNSNGQPLWQEEAVDEWLRQQYARKRADNGRDMVIPPSSVRLDGRQYDDLTPNDWRILDAIINKPGVRSEEVIEHVYGDASDGRENSLTQAIKRLNQRLLDQGCPFIVSQGNGFVSIKK